MKPTIKIKLLNDKAVMPFKASAGAVGYDLTATSIRRDKNNNLMYGLGIAMEIPEGYGVFIVNRSSIKNRDLRCNIGTIDTDYRGEVFAIFSETATPAKIYKVGECVAQMIVLQTPDVELLQAEQLSETQRGAGAFGHTDKQHT